MNDEPRCECMHLRSSHDIEPPYECYGWDFRPDVDRQCQCPSFDIRTKNKANERSRE